MHLLTETSKSHHFPVVLRDDVRAYIVRALKGEHVSGSDIRCAVIHIYQMLSNAKASWKIQTLFLTLVQISQCLYSEDVERCTKQILRFYKLLLATL